MHERQRLPDVRQGRTWRFVIYTREAEEVKGYVTTGEYEGGRLGEVFVKVGKEGDHNALLDQWAIRASVELQRGVPLEEICKKHIGTQFDPAGGTDFKEIPRCTSVLDLVCRYLMLRYGPKQAVEAAS